MLNRRFILLIIAITLLSQACIEKFRPELDGFQQLLVIDGGVFDGSRQIQINLSYSSDVYNPKVIPVTGATVTIADNTGETAYLSEIENGVYANDGLSMIGIPGRSYKLSILTQQGKRYESGFELLRPQIPIESITYQTEYHTDIRYPYSLAGYQFYLNTHLPNDTNCFYMWRMVKTYEYHSEYKADAYYTNKRIYPFPNPDSLQVCWKTENVKQIVLLNTKEVVHPDMSGYPLNFVNTEGRELSVRYSQLTEQLTVNEATFNHYKLVNEGNGEQASLYAHQPFEIKSNVVNIDDPNEAVLGYFLVAGRASHRIFAPNPMNVDFHYYIFVLDADNYKDMRFLKYSSPSTWPIYLTRGGVPNGSLAWPSPECVDCRQRGGSLTKPSFWDVK